jgi:hypothetical protein
LSILRNLRERKMASTVILLTARIHAVTRRGSGAVQSILSVADLSLNPMGALR